LLIIITGNAETTSYNSSQSENAKCQCSVSYYILKTCININISWKTV